MRLARRAWVLVPLVIGCSGPGGAGDAGPDTVDSGELAFVCPPHGVEGSGRHRLFVQGHEAAPREDGTWPFLHDEELCDDATFVNDDGDGVWEPGEEPHPLGPTGLVHGEHFLVGPGALVEIATTLCDDITGDVVFYIPNFDEPGSRALHQLLVVHEGEEQLISEVIDEEPGSSGYNPFVRVEAGVDPVAVPGDRLVLRSVNLETAAFSVMVWRPPSEYESWVVVEVP